MKPINFILGTMTFGESVFLPDANMMVELFLSEGFTEIDTAYTYNGGNSERILGEILSSYKCRVATKINPRVSGKLDGQAAYSQVNESLLRMRLESVDTVYLHFPDPATAVDSVLEACDDLHKQGKFRELGLSNFPSWMVADVWHICNDHGWVLPTVYQGVYNPFARKAEIELNKCLNHYGMRFNAYNPLAGGLLTGRYESHEDTPSKGRFKNRPNYIDRYWKESCFLALDLLKKATGKFEIATSDAVYRWLAYHSMLDGDRGDSVIIGASKLQHLQSNLQATKGGPLPEELLEAFEAAWQICKSDSPNYFTFFKEDR